VADQVVFAKITAGLDRDQGDRNATGVFQPVRLAEGDVDRFPLADKAGAEADSDLGGAFDHDPVFRAVEMGLQRGGFPRGKAQGSDTEAGAFGDGGGRRDRLRQFNGRRRFGKAGMVRSVHGPVPSSLQPQARREWLAGS
jgi:hypothetical protein